MKKSKLSPVAKVGGHLKNNLEAYFFGWLTKDVSGGLLEKTDVSSWVGLSEDTLSLMLGVGVCAGTYIAKKKYENETTL